MADGLKRKKFSLFFFVSFCLFVLFPSQDGLAVHISDWSQHEHLSLHGNTLLFCRALSVAIFIYLRRIRDRNDCKSTNGMAVIR